MDSRLRGNDKEKQIRNPNIEIRNNIECSKFKCSKQKQPGAVVAVFATTFDDGVVANTATTAPNVNYKHTNQPIN